MIDHAYVIDLSKDWQPSLNGVFFAENAPTFLCITSPHHAADGIREYRTYKKVISPSGDVIKVKRVRAQKKIYEPVPDGYINQAQAALESGMKENTISAYIKDGVIHAERRGHHVYVRVVDIFAEKERRKQVCHARNLEFGKRQLEKRKNKKSSK